jgi:hypothetical protein
MNNGKSHILTINIVLISIKHHYADKTYVVTKSWPVTAPGSQGVFRGRGRGFNLDFLLIELIIKCKLNETQGQDWGVTLTKN